MAGCSAAERLDGPQGVPATPADASPRRAAERAFAVLAVEFGLAASLYKARSADVGSVRRAGTSLRWRRVPDQGDRTASGAGQGSGSSTQSFGSEAGAGLAG